MTAQRRILVINPNSTAAFTDAMRAALRDVECGAVVLEYYTAPGSAPRAIEGDADSVQSAAACLRELRADAAAGRWDGFVVACFSAHPLVGALREVCASPAVGILDAPLLLASALGGCAGVLTSSAGWAPRLARDVAALRLAPLNAAGVVASGLAVRDLDLDLGPSGGAHRHEVLRRLGDGARTLRDRGADVVVLGCAGMAGLERDVARAVPGVTVLDPVRCAVEMCLGLVRMRAQTSKLGLYA